MSEPNYIRLVVMGAASPAGSKRAFVNKKTGKAQVVDANKNSRPWKSIVAAEGAARYGGALLRGPLEVDIVFYRKRPKGHFGSGRNSDQIKESAPRYPTSKPDVLKLGRGVEDALTGIIWADDSQIVKEHLYKEYGEPERCEILIRPL